ncbi:DUF6249 domain-containing protein [Flavipsychrobacter stenotrophus]|nr:DUF6249 domain-containing protein [Flavipsychrobacter stenotrophus]
MGSEMLIAPVFFLSFFGMIFGIVYMRNKENMAMIDRGINPRTPKIASPRPFLSLKFGLLLCGVGLGLFLAFLVDELMMKHNVMVGGEMDYREYPQIYFAMIGLFGGLGLVISYLIEKRDWMDKKWDEKETNIKYLPSEKTPS